LPADTRTGLVSRLVNGGQGLIHHPDEGTVLVNDVLPGETVRFHIRERSRGIAWADAVDILTPHPDRITPPCPLARICGGCPWQHMPLGLQRQQKTQIFQDSFIHALHSVPPLTRFHDSPGEGYRVRARMKPDPQGRLGFVRRRSHQIVPISDCLLFTEPINRFLAAWNADPPGLQKLFQVDILHSPGEEGLGIHLGHAPAAGEAERLQGQFPDLLLGWPGQEVVQTITIAGSPTRYHASPAAFFQVNHFLWPVMLDAVERHLPLRFSALDLYSGVGFLIPPLMRGDQPPQAVEGHPLSVELARKTFPHLTIIRSDTSHQEIPDPVDLILCDPPRSGLGDRVLEQIQGSGVKTLLYISCSQATLIRDIRRLTELGWELSNMEAFDLFPHTPHLELFAELKR
jgi:tRNA/tmRNA/rRNA uracil-C5-methylase (TrmA/RlmC/RlmD family)